MKVPDKQPFAVEKWYFAYGSNLSTAHNERRRWLIKASQPAYVQGFQLAFNKSGADQGVYANIVWHPNAIVWGAVYWCDPDAMARLDKAEGAIGGHYRPMRISVTIAAGESFEAVTYVAGRKFITRQWCPGEAYLHLLMQGAQEHALSEQYLKEIKNIAHTGQSVRKLWRQPYVLSSSPA